MAVMILTIARIGAVMKYIGTLQELNILSFKFLYHRSDEDILDSLLYLPSSDLKVFSLKIGMFRHEHTRGHFLAHFWPVLQHILKVNRCLEQLYLTLEDNHPAFNGHWWSNKILDQLPSLTIVLKVKVTIDTQSMFCSIILCMLVILTG